MIAGAKATIGASSLSGQTESQLHWDLTKREIIDFVLVKGNLEVISDEKPREISANITDIYTKYTLHLNLG